MADGEHIAACLKHYIGYGASEAGRDYVYTEISPQTLWDTYMLPYEMGVKAGAVTLMSGFHDISGVPASANHYTMREVLKGRWSFGLGFHCTVDFPGSGGRPEGSQRKSNHGRRGYGHDVPRI